MYLNLQFFFTIDVSKRPQPRNAFFKKLDEVLNFSLTLGINPWQVKVFVLGKCSGCILGTPHVISY